MSVALLDGAQIGEDFERFMAGPRRQEAARRFDEVARPDEVISAEIVVSLVEPPGDGQAGDDRPGKGGGAVGGENGGADAIDVPPACGDPVERLQAALPGPPAGYIGLGRGVEAGHQTGERVVACLIRPAGEPKRK